MTKNKTPLIPPLQPSHRPRLRQSYDPPLMNEQQHRAMVQSWLDNKPEHYQRTDDLPYFVGIMEDGEEILFDYSWRPMWKRQGEGHRAVRCDPKDFYEWFSIFYLYDRLLDPLPKNFEWKRKNLSTNTKARAHLRKMLLLVLEEFCNGGPLFVRQWRPAPVFGGVMVSRGPVPNKILPFRKKDS
jgi:hypothetical protein